jgi:predicted O-methyltransferase YrrM
MKSQNRLRSVLRTKVQQLQSTWNKLSQDGRNLELVLRSTSSYLSESAPVNDPLTYVKNLRNYIEPVTFKTTTVKDSSAGNNDRTLLRFSELNRLLTTNVPPIPFSIAQKLARYADEILGLQCAYEEQNYSGDIGLHFILSSSVGHKGRLIATIIRLMRPGNCLELGTCYGMGSMCILSMLERNGESGKLTTVERFDPMYSLAKERLHQRYGNSVSCHKGNVQDVMPDILNGVAKIGFVFHDASHTKEDYIRDFSLMEPYLASGCVVLIDDIRWGDPRFFSGDPKPYEGWLAVVGHDRVVKALEINNELGLILLS